MSKHVWNKLVGCTKNPNDGQSEKEYASGVLWASERINQLENAVSSIAPWLSASLTDESCEEYRKACDFIFLADKQIIEKIVLENNTAPIFIDNRD